MRFFSSSRRGSNKKSPHVDEFPEYATGSASVVRRQSSRESHRSNISREQNTPTEAEAEVRSKHKWSYRLPFEKKNADASNDDESSKKISPYALHVNEELSPRASAWLYTSAVSIGGLSSFLVTERAMEEVMEDESNGRSFIDKLLIIFLSISFGFSFLITLSYRHRGVREKMTEEIIFIHSIEFVISLIMFGIWCAVLRYVADPFSGLNYGLTMLTKDGYDNVWNTNIWVCAWLGWGLTSYLVGALIMASPTKMSGVWTRGFDGAPSRTLPRHSSTGSSEPTVHAGDIRNANSSPIGAEGDFDGEYMDGTNRRQGENSLGYWFMLLAFSLALAVFSVTLRTGDACGSVLDGTPFCKRSALGGAVGVLCALLSLAAFLLFQMDRMGSFDDLDSKRKMNIAGVESALPFLSLILHSVNLGFSTSPSGPSTQMGNMFLASAMGVVLSLMLCEQMINGNVPRTRCSLSASETVINGDEDRKGNNLSYDSASSSLHNLMPPSRESQDLETGYDAPGRVNGSNHYHSSHATETRARRANGNSSFSDSSSSSDSSYSSSSSDSSSSDSSVSESTESLDLETDEATTSHETGSTHDHAPYDTRTKAMREFISMKSATSKTPTTNKSPGSGLKSSPPVLSSSINPGDDSDSLKKQESSSEGTNTAYSLPEPPPLYASSPSPSPSIINKANLDKSFFPPPPLLHKASDDPPPEELPHIAAYTADNPTDKETSTNLFDYDPHPGDRPYIAAYTVDQPTDKKRSNNSFDSDSDCDESGVELTFEPEDDISTLGCSVAASGKEPDGYKSDDLYNPRTGPGGLSSALRSKPSKKLRNNSRQPASRGQGNNPPLDPVVEHSNPEMESLSAPKTSTTNDNPKQTIEEIMNRGPKGKTKTKSKSSKSKSLHSDKESRVRHVAISFSSHAAAIPSDSSNDGRGPPTIDLAGGNDDAVHRALNQSSFYSQDFTVAESGKIYSS